MMDYNSEVRRLGTKWWLLLMMVMMTVVMEVMGLSGDNVCMVKQKYNITKRVKYRAPMSVRTYVWCFSMPPRCSKWTTEMRDLTRLETDERTAEVAVCCPGYKIKDVSCVPICPNGKTGVDCKLNCPNDKWGPNCVNDCKRCTNGKCSPITGECQCPMGWQGERCEIIIQTTTVADIVEELLTTNKITPKLVIKPTPKITTSAFAISASIAITTSSTPSTIAKEISTVTSKPSPRLESTTEMLYPNKSKISITVPISKSSVTENVLTHTVPMTIHSMPVSTAILEKTTLIDKIASTTTESLQIKESKNDNHNLFINRTIPTTQKSFISTPIEKTTQNNIIIRITKDSYVTPTTANGKFIEQEMIRRQDATTSKFKIKEIWIKPAQKGDATVEYKIKEDAQIRQRGFNKKEQSSTHTTPRTIVVSIIPTSSYTSFKKIALSTASYMPVKSPITTYVPLRNYTLFQADKGNETTNYVLLSTKTPKLLAPTSILPESVTGSTNSSSTDNHIQYSTNKTISNARPTKEPHLKMTKPVTNSMTWSKVNNKSSQLTTAPIISLTSISTSRPLLKAKSDTKEINIFEIATLTSSTTIDESLNLLNQSEISVKIISPLKKATNSSKKNETEININSKTVTTVIPESNEEKFHILTEPEPITDVMGDKVSSRTSVDLTSVISIACGVMMVVISIAILLVMMERRRKPRYDEIRKMDELRMQVYLDENNVPPPPYVRSIFHTPLPEPPIVEKCHYQPISTLDRNIKQFMRPVVVQTISPIMMENFRGILECHYDHLPLRNSLPVHHDDGLAPSMEDCREQLCTRTHSITESTIEALKCEAKQDIIDSTTSEPLYAEIPCWRPPSEHAVEILNLSGEAVTEL